MDDDRISRLERRIERLEDERDITSLITAYGPLVDAGMADEAAALWVEDGVYDVDGYRLHGHDEIADMVRSRPHRRLLADGCAHVLGPAHVVVDGDEAVAVCHSLLVRHADGGFVVARATAHRFSLARGAEGWRIVDRTSRLLDGDEAARTLLGGAFSS